MLSILLEGANPPLRNFAIPLFPPYFRPPPLRLSLLHYPVPSVIPYDYSLYIVLLSFSFPSSSPLSLRFSWRVDLGESFEERRNSADLLEVFRMYELQRFATFVLQQILYIQFGCYHPWSLCHTPRDVKS